MDTQPFKPTAHMHTRMHTLPLTLVRMMIMMMMMGLPDLDMSAGLRLRRDALWLEIYNSLTSASLIDFPSRKVSWFGVTWACMSACMSVVSNRIFSAIPVIWRPVERDFPCICVLFTLRCFHVFLCLAKVLHSGLWVAWHELIWNIWMLSGYSLPSTLKIKHMHWPI